MCYIFVATIAKIGLSLAVPQYDQSSEGNCLYKYIYIGRVWFILWSVRRIGNINFYLM